MEAGKPLVTGHAADRTRISHRIDISPELQQGRVSVLSDSMAIRCIERVAGYGLVGGLNIRNGLQWPA